MTEPAAAAKLRLIADPDHGLVDEPVSWRLVGATAGTSVELVVATTDAAGRRWRSSGTYPVDAEGVLRLDDADRPWWEMVYADRTSPPSIFTPQLPGWTASATATVGAVTARAQVGRLYVRDIDQVERSGPGWVLGVCRPHGRPSPAPGVLVVGGSTGMAAVMPTAALLASRGYPAAVLGYMQQPGTPSGMDRIPIEVLDTALSEFPEADPVAVWAVSVGTALALAALAHRPQPRVRALIAGSPTDVVWQALAEGGPPPNHASLSRNGKDLDYLRMRGELVLPQVIRNQVLRRLPGPPRSTALRLHNVYARSRSNPAAVGRASIPVQRIEAPLLLIAGDADAMWPATQMAGRIRDQRRQAGVDQDDQLLVMPDAGHFLRPPATPTTVDRNDSLVSGGTPGGNARGQRAAWDAGLAFLSRHLG